MKKVLNNPFIVGILALVALYGVYRKVFPKTPKAPPPAQTAEPAKTAAKPVAKTEKFQEVKGFDRGRVGWIPELNRDPFSLPGYTPKKKEKVDVIAELNTDRSDVVKDLDLSAVWRQDNGSLAIINGSVVGEGDSLGAFTIVKIESDQVTVSGPSGESVIQFSNRPAPVATPIPAEDSLAGKIPSEEE